MLDPNEVVQHELVPDHEVLSEAEAHSVLQQYDIEPEQLPKIFASDPAARAARARPGDVIRVVRDSPTAGTAVAYRLVVEG